MSRQLSQSQQIFLQRLAAAHVLSDVEAKKLWKEVSDGFQDRALGRDLNHTFSVINKSLVPNFALEIKSVSLDLIIDSAVDDEGNSGSSSERILYHAIVNKDADAVAKAAATPTFAKTHHDLAFIRIIFEALIEKFNQSVEGAPNDEEEDETTNRKKKKRSSSSRRQGLGCQSFLPRMDMINLRLELPEVHKNKFTILQAEKLIQVLEREGWLVAAQIDGEDDRRQSTSGKKRKSTNIERSTPAKNLQIGPRTYLELPDLLKDLGLERNYIPQLILHA